MLLMNLFGDTVFIDDQTGWVRHTANLHVAMHKWNPEIQMNLCTNNWLNIWAAAQQNQQNDLSAQSDQSLHFALNEKLRTEAFFMRTADVHADLSFR